MRPRSLLAFGILAFVSLHCSSSSSGTNETGVSAVLQSKCSQMCEHLVAAPLSGCGKSDATDVATCKPECIDHVSAHGAEPPEATESDLDCAISAADCDAWKNCGDSLRALLFALFLSWSGAAEAQTFDASLRAFGGLELDDRVLEGPAYGYGADAFVHVAGPFSVGAYAEWREAFLFSEPTQTCDVGDCDRNELLLGGLVRGSMALKPDVYAWLAIGAGYRRHEWVTANGFASDNGSIVSHGIDLLKLELGFDSRLTRFLRVGPYFDWAFGCFYDRHRSFENGSELELENTCPEGPPFVSMGVGFRAGFYVE